MIRVLRPIAILLLLLFSNQGPVPAQDTGSALIVEVVNDAGQPIRDACVTFVPKTGDVLFRKADRRGRVRMKKLNGGNYRVVVKVDGYEAQKKEIVVRETEGTLAFVMKAQKLRMGGSLAYIFPGQGSQHIGMGRDLFDNFPSARAVFEEADEALGFSISELCFSGTAEDLQLTENTQPAILTVSVAAHRAMESEGFPAPDYVAGHSLGEYSALVAAGAISLSDAVRTVRSRGKYMQESTPVGSGAMAAILGAELADVMNACGEAQEGQVCNPANINSPSQIVIAGDTAAVERAMVLLKERGAKRTIKLNVSAPFHCSLMMPAQEQLALDFEKIEFTDLRVPLVTNVDASVIETGDKVGDALVRQVSAPVRWRESVELLIQKGVDRFIEVGPGKVLSGLVRHINRDVRAMHVEDAASLRSTLAAL